MALPVRVEGTRILGQHRFGRHTTNKREPHEIEAEALKALKRGKLPTSRIEVICFRDAVSKFLPWAEVHYRSDPNSYKRIKTSLASTLVFINKTQ